VHEAPKFELTFRPAAGRGEKGNLIATLGDLSFTESLNIARSADRDRFVERLHKEWGDSRWTPTLLRSVREELSRLAQSHVERGDANDGEQQVAEPTPQQRLEQMPESVRAGARRMLEDPNMIEQITRDLDVIGIAGEKRLALTVYLVGVSRLLRKPLATIIQGPSSSGKSYVLSCVARCFPKEAIWNPSQISPKALFYIPRGFLKNRFVVCGERSRDQAPEAAEGTRALREMLSEGRLSKAYVEKGPAGQLETRLIEQEGPISFAETTTLSKVFDEDANRCLILTTDERGSQTRRILQKTALGASGAKNAFDEQAILDRHHAAQRMLEPHHVVVPYAERLESLIDAEQVEMRRAFVHLLSLIQACVLLHQRMRRVDGENRILANAGDYAVARELMLPALNRVVGQRLSEPARRYFEKLCVRYQPGTAFDTHQAADGQGVSERAVRGYLGELVAAGQCEQVERRRSQKPATWQISVDAKSADGPADALLPPLELVFPQVSFRRSDGPEVNAGQHVLSEGTQFSDGLPTDRRNLSEETAPSDRRPEPTTN
jgi:hypothetical protein